MDREPSDQLATLIVPFKRASAARTSSQRELRICATTQVNQDVESEAEPGAQHSGPGPADQQE